MRFLREEGSTGLANCCSAFMNSLHLIQSISLGLRGRLGFWVSKYTTIFFSFRSANYRAFMTPLLLILADCASVFLVAADVRCCKPSIRCRARNIGSPFVSSSVVKLKIRAPILSVLHNNLRSLLFSTSLISGLIVGRAFLHPLARSKISLTQATMGRIGS